MQNWIELRTWNKKFPNKEPIQQIYSILIERWGIVKEGKYCLKEKFIGTFKKYQLTTIVAAPKKPLFNPLTLLPANDS